MPENRGVIIYPTDTIYGTGCDINQQKAVERICRIKNIDPQKAQLSLSAAISVISAIIYKKHRHALVPPAETLSARTLHLYPAREQTCSEDPAKQKSTIGLGTR